MISYASVLDTALSKWLSEHAVSYLHHVQMA